MLRSSERSGGLLGCFHDACDACRDLIAPLYCFKGQREARCAGATLQPSDRTTALPWSLIVATGTRFQPLWVGDCACLLLSLADRRSRRTAPYIVCVIRSICLKFGKIAALPLPDAPTEAWRRTALLWARRLVGRSLRRNRLFVGHWGKHSPVRVAHRSMIDGSQPEVVLGAVRTGHIGVTLYKCQRSKLRSLGGGIKSPRENSPVLTYLSATVILEA